MTRWGSQTSETSKRTHNQTDQRISERRTLVGWLLSVQQVSKEIHAVRFSFGFCTSNNSWWFMFTMKYYFKDMHSVQNVLLILVWHEIILWITCILLWIFCCIRYGERSEDVVSCLALGSGCTVCGRLWSQSSVLGKHSMPRPHHWGEHLGELQYSLHNCFSVHKFKFCLFVISGACQSKYHHC